MNPLNPENPCLILPAAECIGKNNGTRIYRIDRMGEDLKKNMYLLNGMDFNILCFYPANPLNPENPRPILPPFWQEQNFLKTG
jgi:hypothetical protein